MVTYSIVGVLRMSEFMVPKKIYHGAGSLNNLETILKETRSKNVFLLTDPVLKELDVIEELVNIIEANNVKVHINTDVVPEPSLQTGNQLVEKVRHIQPDLVIGVGGGSALDLAKVVAVLVDNEGTIEDYLNLSGTAAISNKGVPKVLIPTTSGTGAEVTDIAVFSLEETKDVVNHEYLLADYAIIDSNLTLTLPSKITAASGIDAFTHALESYTSIYSSPLTKILALESMKKIEKNIRVAVWKGNDKYAREQMSLASLFAGISFYNAGVAAVHGLAYPLGGLFNIPHGESNAVLLPYVYDYIWPSCIKEMGEVAEVLGLPVDGKNHREIAQEVVLNLFYLVEDVGLSTTLKDYGVSESDIRKLTENGIKQTRLLKRSPKQLNEDAVRKIYTNAYYGELSVKV